MSWHGETCGNKGGFSRYFLPTPMTIWPKFSQVCYFIYKLWYTRCGPFDNTVYRKCPMALSRILPNNLLQVNGFYPTTHSKFRLKWVHNIIYTLKDKVVPQMNQIFDIKGPQHQQFSMAFPASGMKFILAGQLGAFSTLFHLLIYL